MKNVPMRFAGYTFRHNPSKLRIEDTAQIMRILSPDKAPDSRRLNRGLRTVSGEGEMYGADCLGQYSGLLALYEQGERGLLSLPHIPPMTAYLKELHLAAEPQEDVLRFSFTFIETLGAQQEPDAEPFYTVTAQGESLWDIAYMNGRTIDELVRLNPQIRYIAELNAGEKVRLC